MDHHPRSLRVLFRVAAGPRVGFGHLVRAASLADALRVPALVSVRGPHPSIGPTARRLGATLVEGNDARRVVARVRPDVLVVDDRVARQTASWRSAARRLQVPIVSIHDLGIGLGDADVVVDGSIGSVSIPRRARGLSGPRYAILNPRTMGGRPALGRAAAPANVVIALGGGPRRSAALRLARALVAARRGLKVAIAGGFVGASVAPPGVPADTLTWIDPEDLGRALARATVAVVGGGVTLYECLALGVPCVAVSVVSSQRPTVAAFAARGAVVDGGSMTGQGARMDAMGRLSARVLAVVRDGRLRGTLRREGHRLVDGLGAARVAVAIGEVARTRSPRRGDAP